MELTSENSLSESGLTRTVSEEKGAASNAILAKYNDALHRFCMGYLGDEALAEEVTRDTFARLSDGRELPSGDLRPWLYKVARNHCLDIMRRRQQSIGRGGLADAARLGAGRQIGAAYNDRQELMRQVLSNMPEEYRSVLMLKHVEGLSRAEIAEALEVSEPTIKGRLVRASEHLREALRNQSGSIS